MTTAFKKKYGIEVETVTARSLQLIEKMFTERRAGLNMVDAFISGTTDMILRLKPAGVPHPLEREFLLPELTDPLLIQKLWYEGKMTFVDRETRLILSFAAYTTVPFAINTEMVKPDELKSYKDLLQPKWKGKISINDPTMPGAGGKWFGMALWAKMADLDYMKKLAEQEPAVLTDTRLQVDWLARGKYPVAIAAKTGVFTDFVEAGAPVQRVPAPVEGAYVSSGGGNIALIKDRPHPNATRLYLNWLLTQEGQTVFSVASGRQSRRLDVPKEHADPAQRIEPGVKYANGDDEEYLSQENKYYDFAKEIFGRFIRG
jgi:iron(III) transport system substrate-binding protein